MHSPAPRPFPSYCHSPSYALPVSPGGHRERNVSPETGGGPESPHPARALPSTCWWLSQHSHSPSRPSSYGVWRPACPRIMALSIAILSVLPAMTWELPPEREGTGLGSEACRGPWPGSPAPPLACRHPAPPCLGQGEGEDRELWSPSSERGQGLSLNASEHSHHRGGPYPSSRGPVPRPVGCSGQRMPMASCHQGHEPRVRGSLCNSFCLPRLVNSTEARNWQGTLRG